jgi:hypothetical protein
MEGKAMGYFRHLRAVYVRMGQRRLDTLAQPVPSGHGAPPDYFAKAPLTDEATVQLGSRAGLKWTPLESSNASPLPERADGFKAMQKCFRVVPEAGIGASASSRL